MLKKPTAESLICLKTNNEITIIGKSVIKGDKATLKPCEVPPRSEAEITKAKSGPGANPTPSPKSNPWIKNSTNS